MGALVTKKGNPLKPPRVLIYGVEGVGKSTFGAKADRPVFISPEGGTDRLTTKNGERVDEIPGVQTWTQFVAALNAVLTSEHNFKTLVIDSADWVEKLAHAHIIGDSGKSIITAGQGYGHGYRQSESMHSGMIKGVLTDIREKRGMNIIVTAHAHVKPVKDPSMAEDYDSYEIKCHELVSSLWREWVDALFFVRFKTLISTSEDTVKARAVTDGTRVCFTQKDPSYQAKNRYDLPREIAFTQDLWDGFIAHAQKVESTAQKPMTIDDLKIAMNDLWVQMPEGDVKKLVHKTVVEAGDDMGKLMQIHGRLVEMKNKKEAA